MNMKRYMKLSLICLIFIFYFDSNFKNAMCKNNQKYDISYGTIEAFSKYAFIIKSKNIIYEDDEKQIKVPIFQGGKKDIKYSDFLEYCYDKKYLKPDSIETYFVIKSERGKMTQTFQDFMLFYKANILKDTDLNKPAFIIQDGCAPELYYDFIVDGMPFVLMIKISVDNCDVESDEPFSFQSVFDIKLVEKLERPIFLYKIWKNRTSKDF